MVSPAYALGAAEPQYRIRLFGEDCLSGASFRAILFGAEAEAHWRPSSEQGRRGRAWAEMVLVPFAETKGTRRRGRNPAFILK